MLTCISTNDLADKIEIYRKIDENFKDLLNISLNTTDWDRNENSEGSTFS